MSPEPTTPAITLHQRVHALFEAHPQWDGLVSGGWRGTYRTATGDTQIRREWDLDGDLGNQLRAVVKDAQHLDHTARQLQDVALVAVRAPEGMQMWVYETHVGSPLGDHTVEWSLGEHDEHVMGLPVTTRWPLTAEGLDMENEQEWTSGAASEWAVVFDLPSVPAANQRLVETGLNEFLTTPELSEQQVRQLGRHINAMPVPSRRRRGP